jgi:D-lyxose ketol-isomerase
MQTVPKVWGSENWIVNNERYCAKYLNLNQGYECSVHYHAVKDETFVILEGEIELKAVELKDHMEIILPLLNEGEPESIHEDALAIKSVLLNKMGRITLVPGDSFRVKPFVAHQFKALTPTAKILEVSTTHYEEDSYRLTESRKI